jgi:hypothetical protein
MQISRSKQAHFYFSGRLRPKVQQISLNRVVDGVEYRTDNRYEEESKGKLYDDLQKLHLHYFVGELAYLAEVVSVESSRQRRVVLAANHATGLQVGLLEELRPHLITEDPQPVRGSVSVVLAVSELVVVTVGVVGCVVKGALLGRVLDVEAGDAGGLAEGHQAQAEKRDGYPPHYITLKLSADRYTCTTLTCYNHEHL